MVIGHEKLAIDVSRLLGSTTVLRFPKSPGVVDQNDAYLSLVHSIQTRAYFYGDPAFPLALQGRSVPREPALSPYSFQIGWETLKIYRVGEENAAPSSALPLGSARILSSTRLTRVDPSGPAHVVRLMNGVLGLVGVSSSDRVDGKKVEEVKAEEVAEDGEAGLKEEEGEEEEEEEVPWKEEIGWREVLGFIVMSVLPSTCEN